MVCTGTPIVILRLYYKFIVTSGKVSITRLNIKSYDTDNLFSSVINFSVLTLN